jgi:hypothetical protein
MPSPTIDSIPLAATAPPYQKLSVWKLLPTKCHAALRRGQRHGGEFGPFTITAPINTGSQIYRSVLLQ